MAPVIIPIELQTCRAFPAKVTSDKQSAAGKYTTTLAGVAIDCKTKLHAVVDLTIKHNVEAAKIAAEDAK